MSKWYFLNNGFGLEAKPVIRMKGVLPILAIVLLSSTLIIDKAQTQAPVVRSSSASALVEERLARIERVVGSKALVELVEQIDLLRTEVSTLKGQLEEQSHHINRLKEQQKKLYKDLHRRIKTLESPAELTDSNTSSGNENSTLSSDDRVFVEQRAYQVGLDQLKAGSYKQAIVGFTDFLKNYPNGRYADNAQYWLAETYYVSREFAESLEAFRTVIERYPDSSKVPGARLKIGFIHHELDNLSEAREILSTLIKEYPNTSIGELARERLKQIN